MQGRKAREVVSDERRKVVEKIAEDMETLQFDWVRPWMPAFAPRNPVTGTVYRGGNRIHLAAKARLMGHTDQRWATFAQGKKAGWSLKKGSESAVVERWRMVGTDDEDEEGPRAIPVLVGYWRVFNLEDFEGAPAQQLPRRLDGGSEALAAADEVIARWPVEYREQACDTACYIPARDAIVLPERSSFLSAESFARTLLHETIHSTGHPDRLARFGLGPSSGAEYAFEELVAELGSMFSASELGVPFGAAGSCYENHVSYLQSWIALMKDDPDAIFRAASKAEAAVDMVLRSVRPDREAATHAG